MSKSTLFDHKDKNKLLRGNNSNASLSLALDTIAPNAEILASISYLDGKVEVDFDSADIDIAYFKTWGDYDTSPSGINYDLCGETEADAPWVDYREFIDYSTFDLLPLSTHTFFFKLRDDVWNESSVIRVDGSYEQTTLIDVSEFTKSKESYITLLLDSDNAVSDTFYRFDILRFDTFDYTEAVTDDPSERPYLLFCKDISNSKEKGQLLFEASDSGRSYTNVIQTLPIFSETLTGKDFVIKDARLMLQDSSAVKESIQFIQGDVRDSVLLKESGLVNISFADAAGPYGVFFYFAVDVKARISAIENLEMLQGVSDEGSGYEQFGQGLVLWEQGNYAITQRQTEYKIYKDSTFYFEQEYLQLFSDQRSGSEDTLYLSLPFSEIPKLNIKSWADADLLSSDPGKAFDTFAVTIPVDYTGVSAEHNLISLSLFDAGEIQLPKWNFEVNSFETANSKASLITDIGANDYLYATESSVVLLALSDQGFLLNPKWFFEVNAFEFVSDKEQLVSFIGSEDSSESTDFAITNVCINDRIKAKFKFWNDVDYLLHDSSLGLDTFVISLPVDYLGVLSESSVLDLACYDVGIAPDPRWIFVVNSFEETISNEKLYSGVIGKDSFISWDTGNLNIPGKDQATGFDVLKEFIKNFFDVGFGNSFESLDVLGSDAVLSEDFGLLDVIGTDINPLKDCLAYIDADLLYRDYSTSSQRNILSVPVNDDFIVREESVITLWTWEHSDAKFVVTISKDDRPIRYLYEFDEAYSKDVFISIYQRTFDTGNAYDTSLVNLSAVDVSNSKDLLTLFEKIFQTNIKGKDYVSSLDLLASDTVISTAQAYIGVFGTDLFTYRDFIIEQYKTASDSAGLNIESGIVNLGDIERVLSFDYALLNNFVSDRFIGNDKLIEFQKTFLDIGRSKEEPFISQFKVDTGLIYDTSVIGVAYYDFGSVKSKIWPTMLLKQKDFVTGKLNAVTTLVAQEFIYTKESALLLPCLFEVVHSEDNRLPITVKILQKDSEVLFDSAVISVVSNELVLTANIIEDAVIAPIINESGFGHDIFSGKEFRSADVAFSCVNTVIYDPTITQRDLIYWWEQGYKPGTETYTSVYDSKGEHFVVNPLFNKEIELYDVDYPYLRDDPNYGKSVPKYASPKNMYASWVCNKEWGGGRTYSNINYSYDEYMVMADDLAPLFTTHSPIFSLKSAIISVVDNIGSLPLYIQDYSRVPWSSDFVIYVECMHYQVLSKDDPLDTPRYVSLSMKPVPSLRGIKSYHLDDESHIVTTEYEFLSSDNFEVNAYDLFPGYDLTRDYFNVYFYAKHTWFDRWLNGFSYAIKSSYTFTGEYMEANPLYIKSRRQVFYTSDQWFVPTDLSYYDPIIYKLYINMGCGVNQIIDRPPETDMDKFVLDKMTKYSKLDITAPFIGDHAVVDDTAILNLALEINVTVTEKVKFTVMMTYFEEGFFCEDIVIYSRNDFVDRDLLFWWNKDYLVQDKSKWQRNPLIGQNIYPGDFDYPYGENDTLYGNVIMADKYVIDPLVTLGASNYYYSSIIYVPSGVFSDNYTTFYPVAEVKDGLDYSFFGSLTSAGGLMHAYLVYIASPLAIKITGETIIPASSVFRQYILADLGTVRATYETEMINPPDVYINHFTSVTKSFALQKDTIYLYDVYEKFSGLDPTQYNFYIGFLVVPSLEIERGYPYYPYPGAMSKDKAFISAWKININVINLMSFSDEYLAARSYRMHPTDGGVLPTDFYPDLFGFKFYANLGCGPSVTAFPVDAPVDEFERWVFTKARTGNYNLDYLYPGDLGLEQEDAIENVWRLWEIDVKFRVYFNNYEFTVFDKGAFFEYDPDIHLLSADVGGLIEKSPIISIPEVIEYHSSYVISIGADLRLFERATVNIEPLFDILGSDENESLMESTVLDLFDKDYVEADFKVTFTCVLNVNDNALGAGKELLAIPLDANYFTVDDSVINLPQVATYEGEEHSRIIEFKYVNDHGDSTSVPLVMGGFEDLFKSLSYALVNIANIASVDVSERIWPDRTEVYRDVGYVCFWVQIAMYPYVINWLAGHFVDYFANSMQADYVRFSSCFGIPPGNWPPVQNFPDHRIVPGDYSGPTLEKRPGHESEGYRWKEEYKPVHRDSEHGYIRIPLPGGEVAYILDPTNPPEPYVWVGGTSIFLTKTILDLTMSNPLMVEDVFYFALFDLDGNIVSNVQVMTLTDMLSDSGNILPGSCFGAMVFFDLDPNTTYVVKETDKFGVPIIARSTSEYSGNTYVLPKDGLEVSTGDEGVCVDAGDISNLVESFGPGGNNHFPGSHNYNPTVYPVDPGKPPYDGPGRKAPFVIPTEPYRPFPPAPVPPFVDHEYFPPINPYPFPADDEPTTPEDVSGYEGKLVHPYDIAYVKGSPVINIPVDMLATIWEYHYIPATFVLELSGMRIEFMDDFDFEIESPFKFDSSEMLFEIEEPFKFDSTQFFVELDKSFLFDEYPLLLEYTPELNIDETYFEFAAMFEDMKFDYIDYDGEQIVPAPEVIAEVIVYDGNEHELCYPRGSYGTIYYQVDGEETTWSTEIPKRTEAGSYIVKWYSMASLEYIGDGTSDDYYITNCSIRKATPEIDLEKAVVYYSKEKEISFIYIGDGEVSCITDDARYCTCEVVSQELIAKNTYRVTIKLYGVLVGISSITVKGSSGNNYLPIDKTIDVDILSVNMIVVAYPVVMQYTGENPVSNISVLGPSEYTILYSSTPTTSEVVDLHPEIDFYKNVGDYTVYFVISADNYKTYHGKFRLTITPIPQHIVLTPYHGMFDYMTHSLIVDVSGVHGTMWYSFDRVNWSTTIPSGVFPGIYTIYWYCVAEGNYYDEGTATYPNKLEVEIEKMEIVDRIPDQVIDLLEPVLSLIIPTPSMGRIGVTCSDFTVLDLDITGLQLTLTGLKEGGAFVNVHQAEDFFYKEHIFTFHVEVVDTAIKYTTHDVITTYDGNFVEQSGVVVIYPDPRFVNIMYSKEPITPTSVIRPTPAFYKDAGEYNIYFMLSAYDFTSVYDSYRLLINKAPNAVNAHGVLIDYDGEPHTLITVEPGYYGTMYFSVNGRDWTTIVPRGIYKGVYTVYWYCKGDKNHLDVGSPDEPYSVTTYIGNLMSFDGRVINANTGNGVSGATVNIRFNDEKTGDLYTQVVTGSDGNFTTLFYDLTTYTAEVICEGFYTEYFKFSTNSENRQLTPFVILPLDSSNSIVLTWGYNPRDLDGALYRTSAFDKEPFVIDFLHREYVDDSGRQVAMLVVDWTTRYGPETIRVYDLDGEFEYYVSDYNKTHYPINALLHIYIPGKDTVELRCDEVLYQRRWFAFKIVNGEIIIVDQIVD